MDNQSQDQNKGQGSETCKGSDKGEESCDTLASTHESLDSTVEVESVVIGVSINHALLPVCPHYNSLHPTSLYNLRLTSSFTMLFGMTIVQNRLEVILLEYILHPTSYIL